MTTDEWLRNAAEQLSFVDIAFPQMEARVILQSVLDVSKEHLVASSFDFEPEDADRLLSRRLQLEPLAYVVGYKDFYGRRFLVDRRVLIPRPETELLVQYAVENVSSGMACVDVGTGSGCIGITAQLEVVGTKWLCTDISADALEVARTNATNLGAKVELIECDLLKAFSENSLDLVVSNLPYIAKNDPRIDDSVTAWEPEIALFSENDGISHIAKLVAQCEHVLKSSGKLGLEIGVGQAEAVSEMLQGWSPKVIKDLAGIDRVISATKPNSD